MNFTIENIYTKAHFEPVILSGYVHWDVSGVGQNTSTNSVVRWAKVRGSGCSRLKSDESGFPSMQNITSLCSICWQSFPIVWTPVALTMLFGGWHMCSWRKQQTICLHDLSDTISSALFDQNFQSSYQIVRIYEYYKMIRQSSKIANRIDSGWKNQTTQTQFLNVL